MRPTLTNLLNKLYTFVGYLKMCDEKGKPFVRMGPRLRQILNVFDSAGSGEAKRESNLAKPEQNYPDVFWLFRGSRDPDQKRRGRAREVSPGSQLPSEKTSIREDSVPYFLV